MKQESCRFRSHCWIPKKNVFGKGMKNKRCRVQGIRCKVLGQGREEKNPVYLETYTLYRVI